jgi:hypothetical protein
VPYSDTLSPPDTGPPNPNGNASASTAQGGAADANNQSAQAAQASQNPNGSTNLVFDRVTNTMAIYKNGQLIATVAAENYTINPKGDPYEVGSNGPAPHGVYHVGPVLHWDETAKDKQSYGTEGVIALSGPGNSNLAQERLIRIHAGEDAYFARGASDNYDHAWTEGCIRVSEQTMVLLERTLNPNPSQNTLIIK